MIKVKKTFSERWMKRLSDNFESIKESLHNTFVCHDKLDDAMMETYDYLFTIAKSAKVTPKAFAKMLANKEALYEYSNKVVIDIIDMKEKAEAKLAQETAKLAAKAEKAAKKASKVKAK
jgi:hypothetical protein